MRCCRKPPRPRDKHRIERSGRRSASREAPPQGPCAGASARHGGEREPQRPRATRRSVVDPARRGQPATASVCRATRLCGARETSGPGTPRPSPLRKRPRSRRPTRHSTPVIRLRWTRSAWRAAMAGSRSTRVTRQPRAASVSASTPQPAMASSTLGPERAAHALASSLPSAPRRRSSASEIQIPPPPGPPRSSRWSSDAHR